MAHFTFGLCYKYITVKMPNFEVSKLIFVALIVNITLKEVHFPGLVVIVGHRRRYSSAMLLPL